MVKVSITLPNSAQISFEAEETEIIRGVVGIVLRDLPRDLMHHVPNPDGAAPSSAELEKSISVTGDGFGESPDTAHQENIGAGEAANNGGSEPLTSPRSGGRKRASARSPLAQDPTSPYTHAPDPRSPEQESDFAEFCRSANPMGDMRRVVVAAEGANRMLGMPSVDAEDLAGLFEVAGWRRAHNFTQTLRNAARDKFRWLERVPGRAGRYTVTAPGRLATLGQ